MTDYTASAFDIAYRMGDDELVEYTAELRREKPDSDDYHQFRFEVQRRGLLGELDQMNDVS